MLFYGIAGCFISIYLWWIILLKIGYGYNEFDCQQGMVFLFRWGFPGKHRKIRIRCFITDIEAISLQMNTGILGYYTVYLKLKDKSRWPLYSMGELNVMENIEKEAAKIAHFLQVPLEYSQESM
jgi:hypothetical protein